MEKEINGKKYQIKGFSYLEGIELDEVKTKQGNVVAAKRILEIAVGLSEEEINKLSLSEGKALVEAVNECNELDFQEPTK